MHTLSYGNFFVNPFLAAARFSGADAATFLQGQISADVVGLQIGQWKRAAYCSPKGRIIVTMIILCESAESYIAILPTSNADDVISRLSRFVLRAKVKTQRLPAPIESQCEHEEPNAPQNHLSGQSRTENEYIYIDENDNWQLRLRVDNGDSDNAASDSNTEKDNTAAWQQGQIMRGMPWIDAAAAELFIPQYVNWDILDGVDFSKGCYVGQEIVARLHYIGNVKRRVYVARAADVTDSALPIAGNKTDDGGDVVNAAVYNGVLLVLISIARDLPPQTQWQDIPLTINEPPYPLPTAEEDKKPRPKV